MRRNKIVILDEPTAEINPETELKIQKFINEKFKDATVMTIAHRIETISKSDYILFMDDGRAVEFNSPKILLANPNSRFSQLKNTMNIVETKQE